jgi:hypothetical protein
VEGRYDYAKLTRRRRVGAGRYGQVLLAAGIAPIPTALFTQQAALDLAAAEVWFVARVLAGPWDASLPRVSLRTLAAQSGVSLTQLHRYQATLLSRQHLTLQPRFDPRTGGQLPSGYDFGGLFARLETLLAAEGSAANPIAEEDLPSSPDLPEGADTSLVARFGRLIAGAGLAALPQALFTHQRALALKPAHVWFVGYLLAHRWSTDFPYPSLRKMAARNRLQSGAAPHAQGRSGRTGVPARDPAPRPTGGADQ